MISIGFIKMIDLFMYCIKKNAKGKGQNIRYTPLKLGIIEKQLQFEISDELPKHTMKKLS